MGPATAHTVPAMALSEPILPSFATFASPCERGLQEVRAARVLGRRGSGVPGHRVQGRVLEMTRAGVLTAGGVEDLKVRGVRSSAVRS